MAPPPRHRRLIGFAVLLLVVVGGGVAIGFALTRPRGTSPARGARSQVPATPSTPTTERPAAPPLTITSITPAAGATGVGGMTPISVTFSSAIASSSTLPALAPSTAGSWAVHGETLTFTPTEAFVPLSKVTVSVPAGIAAADGTMLARAEAATFEVVGGSPLRLQQLLSQLDYSPLSWAPSGSAISPSDAVPQRAALFDPPTGTFSWRQTGWPRQLLSMWKEGRFNVMTRGLVMSFQADHGLDVSGEPTAGLWNDLLSVLAAGDFNTGGYNFALASQAKPESLKIWHNGAMVLRVPMNSGIAASPTPDGTFPVFARYRSQVMRGTNPDGVTYADPVQYVAYFHSGDAVHYLARANYGIPQSLGCVELSLADAARAWPWLAYGTPVAIIN